MDDDLANLTEQLETSFLTQIAQGLRGDTLDLVQCKEAATEFLKLEPFTSVGDARTKAASFAEQYPAFGALKHFVDKYIEEKRTKAVVEKMKKLLQANEVDEALKVAGGTE